MADIWAQIHCQNMSLRIAENNYFKVGEFCNAQEMDFLGYCRSCFGNYIAPCSNNY